MKKQLHALKQFLSDNKITHRVASDSLNISRQYFTEVANDRQPSVRLAKEIESFTHGAVKAVDFFDL